MASEWSWGGGGANMGPNNFESGLQDREKFEQGQNSLLFSIFNLLFITENLEDLQPKF